MKTKSRQTHTPRIHTKRNTIKTNPMRLGDFKRVYTESGLRSLRTGNIEVYKKDVNEMSMQFRKP